MLLTASLAFLYLGEYVGQAEGVSHSLVVGESVKCDPELHHNLLVLHAVVLHVPSWVLVDIEGVHDAERQLVRLALSGKSARLLHRDHLRVRIELIEEEDEEFVE